MNGKYFKYAIGEIVLVVVGILIALSINNWNEQRKNNQRAQEYMKGLIDDLKSDSIQYQITKRYYQDYISQTSTLFLNQDYEKIGLDSLNALIDQNYMVDRLTNHTFQKITNSGLSDLIGSSKSNKAINDYYSIIANHYKAFLEYDKEQVIKELDFWFYNPNYEAYNSNFNVGKSLLFMDEELKRKKDLIKLLESTEGRNNLRNAITRKELGIRDTNRALSEATELINLLKSELLE